MVIFAACAALAAFAGPSRAQPLGDADAGRRVYQTCRPCHDIGARAQHRSGPHLNGIFGRPAGQLEDYAFSLPLVSAGLHGLVWDEDTLAVYVADPQGLVPGVRMPHIGVADEQKRADLIAYLREASAEGAKEPARPRAKLHE